MFLYERATTKLKAKEKNVAIGAHIGFNDIQGFGYRPVELKEEKKIHLELQQEKGSFLTLVSALKREQNLTESRNTKLWKCV